MCVYMYITFVFIYFFLSCLESAFVNSKKLRFCLTENKMRIITIIMMMMIIIIIVKLAESIKTNIGNVVSNIIPPGDNYKTKIEETNKILVKLCRKKGMSLVGNHNINSKSHLRTSKLHLNNEIISILVRKYNSFLTSFKS